MPMNGVSANTKPYTPTGGDAHGTEHGRQRQPAHSVGAEERGVGTEAMVRRQHATREVAGAETEQPDHESDDEPTVDRVPLDEHWTRAPPARTRRQRERDAEHDGSPDDRAGADPVGPAARHGPGQLLFERLHDPVAETEQQAP